MAESEKAEVPEVSGPRKARGKSEKECPDIRKCSYPHCSCMAMRFGAKAPLEERGVRIEDTLARMNILVMLQLISDQILEGKFKQAEKGIDLVKNRLHQIYADLDSLQMVRKATKVEV